MSSKMEVSLQQVSVGYGRKPLIRDINIEIEKGEILTLIGPNGAGKSTILKSITRQLQLISGKVLVGRASLQDLKGAELAKKMAVVLTNRSQTELMTCYDVVASGRYPYTGSMGILSPKDRRKVEEALRMVHGEDLAHQDFMEISDGQKQRILLARAFCQEPEIMVLDEPTSYLDLRYKLELLSLLKRMAKENQITVIMSLHEIEFAGKMSDKILCVKGDRIFDYGTPEEIYNEEKIRQLYDIEEESYDSCFEDILSNYENFDGKI